MNKLNPTNLNQALAVLVCGLLLNACTFHGSSKPIITNEGDGPPQQGRFDPKRIIPVQPKFEPKSKYGNPESYTVLGKTYYVLPNAVGYQETGIASWYGKKFHGKRTSSGEPYDMYQLTAAHKTLPLPSYVEVTNLKTKKKIIVKVNDRGPFHAGRIIDLSYAAAHQLGVTKKGTAPVLVKVINTQEQFSQTSQAENIFVQVGAFGKRQSAERLAEKLRQHVKTAVRLYPVEQGHSVIYRVRAGPFADEGYARKLAAQLITKGFNNAMLAFKP